MILIITRQKTVLTRLQHAAGTMAQRGAHVAYLPKTVASRQRTIDQ